MIIRDGTATDTAAPVRTGACNIRGRITLEAVCQNIGFLVCALSRVLQDLEAGTVVLPFPLSDHLVAPHPSRLRISIAAAGRPQVQRFAT